MPLIVFSLSYPVSADLVSAADLNLCLVLPTPRRRFTQKSQTAHAALFEESEPVAEQRHRL